MYTFNQLTRAQVIPALQQGSAVFVIAADLNPHKFAEQRTYLNPNNVCSRVDVNQCAIQYSAFGCSTSHGMAVRFFKEL